MNDAIIRRVFGISALAMALGVTLAAGAAAEETLELVRPGGEGRPYWNRHATWFMYRPKLCFPALDGATNYAYAVIDDHHVNRAYEGRDSETAIPSEIWAKMPTGFFTVQCFGVLNGAKALAGERRCWKLEPFRPSAHPKAPRGYREAAAKGYEYLLDCPWSQTLRKTGRPDPKLVFACYPSTVCGSIIHSMLRLSALKPSRRADALALARSAADYLMSVSEKPGAALEGLPPTYSDDPDYFRNAAVKFKGLTMLAQPAWAGQQILALGVATNERKYRDYGIKVAETFLRLQETDGTWDWRKRLKDGSGVVGPKGRSHRLYPVYPIWLMKEAFAATGDVRYRESTDRAWRYILENPAKTFDWESQHEDVDPQKEYVNLTPKNAADTVTFILERDPQNAALLELARDCMRFCEDQFVVWANPSRDGVGYNSDLAQRYGKDYSRWFQFPAACEQYGYLVPCDATAGRIVRGWVSLYKLTKDPLDLAKARAMGDAIVRIQEPSGRIQTEWRRYFTGHPEEDWLDDMTDTLIALEALASVEDGQRKGE